MPCRTCMTLALVGMLVLAAAGARPIGQVAPATMTKTRDLLVVGMVGTHPAADPAPALPEAEKSQSRPTPRMLIQSCDTIQCCCGQVAMTIWFGNKCVCYSLF